MILPLLWWYTKTMSSFIVLVPTARFCHPPALYFSSSFRPTSFRLRGWQAEELRTNSICLSVHVCLGNRRDAAGGWSSLLSGFLPSGTLTLITNRHTLTRLCQTCVLRALPPPPLQLSPHCAHLCLRVFLHCFPVSPALSDFAEDLTWKLTCHSDADWWINLSQAGEHLFLCPGASVASDTQLRTAELSSRCISNSFGIVGVQLPVLVHALLSLLLHTCLIVFVAFLHEERPLTPYPCPTVSQ